MDDDDEFVEEVVHTYELEFDPPALAVGCGALLGYAAAWALAVLTLLLGGDLWLSMPLGALGTMWVVWRHVRRHQREGIDE